MSNASVSSGRKKPVTDTNAKPTRSPSSQAAPRPPNADPSWTQPAHADVVISLNGRDAGKRFLVVGTQDEYSLIADGKGRRAEKPKRKKNKHLKLEDKGDGPLAEKIKGGEKVTNNEIRRALAEYAATRGEKGGM